MNLIYSLVISLMATFAYYVNHTNRDLFNIIKKSVIYYALDAFTAVTPLLLIFFNHSLNSILFCCGTCISAILMSQGLYGAIAFSITYGYVLTLYITDCTLSISVASIILIAISVLAILFWKYSKKEKKQKIGFTIYGYTILFLMLYIAITANNSFTKIAFAGIGIGDYTLGIYYSIKDTNSKFKNQVQLLSMFIYFTSVSLIAVLLSW